MPPANISNQHPAGSQTALPALREQVDVALLRMAFSRLRLSVIMTFAVIALFVGLLWPYFEHRKMVDWLVVLIGVGGARYAMWSIFTRASDENQTKTIWRVAFSFAAILAGASWSFGAVTLMPPQGATESMLLSLTVIAVTAVSMVTLTAHLPAMFGFQIAALGPTAWALFATGGEVEQLAAMIVLAGTVILMIVGRGSGVSTRSLLETELRLSMAVAETEDARTRAEAASEAKSQFLATMSHEIRTPMNGVIGMTELLLASDLPVQQRQWTEAVHASGQHLLGVINDILDFSKIESGYLELESIHFSLSDVVEDALAMFAEPAEKKGLELAAQFIPCDAPLDVRGDPFRLRQVIINLISNAVKYTSAGEVIIRVTRLPGSAAMENLRIEVRDTGVGIPPEAQATIFEHFSQADGSTTRQYGGTGLGLAISQRLLHLMGGTIRVDSSINSGSTFTIDIALPSVTVARRRLQDHSQLRGVRILVVDDNATNREILLHQLQSWGMDVTCVAGAREALQSMHRAVNSGRGYELAILDLHMPQVDGLALAHAIQADQSLSGTLLVMLSSTCIVADQDERRRAGILRYLNKPIRRADLLKSLLGVLEGTSCAGAADNSSPTATETNQLTGHVLLVEDNDINQVLAESMLRKLGVTWVLAANGAEAVEAVRNQSFDVILMDCQMPVMDGFEATAHIRAFPDPERARVPIVALTANAMQGDDQACLDAGMNRFLAKPYSLQSLHDTLSFWLKPQTSDPATPADRCQNVVQVVDEIVINPKALQTLRDLDETGSDVLLKRIVTSFLSTAEGQMEKLDQALQANNPDDLRQTAHAWKSSAANLGADFLAATLKDLENCARRNRLSEARDLIIETRVQKDRATAVLGVLLKGLA